MNGNGLNFSRVGNLVGILRKFPDNGEKWVNVHKFEQKGGK